MERKNSPKPSGMVRKAKPQSTMTRKIKEKPAHTKFVWCPGLSHYQHVDVCKEKCRKADKCKILRRYYYSIREVTE